MAFDGRKLIIAAAGLLALHLGWRLLDAAFVESADVTPDLMTRPPVAQSSDDFARPAIPIERLSEPARILITPLLALLEPGSRFLTMLHALLAMAWLIGVWGFCGGAIARIAAIQEARSRQPGVLEAAGFAWRSIASLILAPAYPLLALAFCAVTGLVLGLLYRAPMGSAIAGILLVLPLLAGVVMTLLVAALMAGWPLFHAAIATGADDALDAVSRTYSYLNQRLVLFAAGAAIATVGGLVGLILVDWLAAVVVRLTRWSLSLAGLPSEISDLFGPGPLRHDTVASAAHRFWLGTVRLLTHAWAYSYFWSAATLLYLWLRREVDGTPTTVIDRTGFGPNICAETGDSAASRVSAT
jgi:hypothetical protein